MAARSTLVTMISFCACTPRANRLEARSLSTTPSTPTSRSPSQATGMPPPPQAIATTPACSRQLAAASRRSDRTNAVRNSDLALERTDPEYVTRASSNNAHFLLARPDINMDPETYVRLALSPKSEVNALATYAWYHLRAL